MLEIFFSFYFAGHIMHKLTIITGHLVNGGGALTILVKVKEQKHYLLNDKNRFENYF